MTYYYYKTNTWPTQAQPTEDLVRTWKHLSEKKNWRIVQLPNGYFQTEHKGIDCECDPDGECCGDWHDVTRRETIESAEAAIDGSIEHYEKKLEFLKGPKVVKTFK